MLHRLLPVKMFLIQSLHDSLSHRVSAVGVVIHLIQRYNLAQPQKSFYDIHPSITGRATPEDTTRLEPTVAPMWCGTSGLSTYRGNTKTNSWTVILLLPLPSSAFLLRCPFLPACRSCLPSISRSEAASTRQLHRGSSKHPHCCLWEHRVPVYSLVTVTQGMPSSHQLLQSCFNYCFASLNADHVRVHDKNRDQSSTKTWHF